VISTVSIQKIENESIQNIEGESVQKIADVENVMLQYLLLNDPEHHKIFQKIPTVPNSEACTYATNRLHTSEDEVKALNGIIKKKLNKNEKFHPVFLVKDRFNSMTIKFKSFRSLKSETLVEDTIIDGYCLLLSERYPDNYYFPISFTYFIVQTICDYENESKIIDIDWTIELIWIKKYFQKLLENEGINIFTKKKLYFPISYPIGKHFGCVEVQLLPKKQFKYFDTCHNCGSYEGRYSIMENIEFLLSSVKYYYEHELGITDENFNVNVKPQYEVLETNTPQQSYNYECGIFICIIIDVLSADIEDLNIVNSENEQNLRSFVASSLKRGISNLLHLRFPIFYNCFYLKS